MPGHECDRQDHDLAQSPSSDDRSHNRALEQRVGLQICEFGVVPQNPC